jgi:predicted lactoylglutathione lyase
MLFVNLPVRDVRAAAACWAELGFSADPQFCDERTSNVVVDDNIVVMLLERSRFQDFVTGPIAEPAAGTGALYCLSADGREAVDTLADKALAAGASAWKPAQDHGFMYGRSFADLDGHVWEVMWMDVAAAAAAHRAGADQQLADATA